jgi:hypothetical protein
MSDIGVTIQESSVGVQARHLLVATQSVFFGSLLICIVINHGPIARNDGISFCGVYAPTVLILIAGFSIAAVGLWRTARYFAQTDAPAFSVVALGLFALLLTPYNQRVARLGPRGDRRNDVVDPTGHRHLDTQEASLGFVAHRFCHSTAGRRHRCTFPARLALSLSLAG